jgi:hypothetical protein
MSRQNEVSDKIEDAKRKITDLKHQRSKEKRIFREREKRLKEQLEHQLDSARASEQRAEEVQEELKVKMYPGGFSFLFRNMRLRKRLSVLKLVS